MYNLVVRLVNIKVRSAVFIQLVASLFSAWTQQSGFLTWRRWPKFAAYPWQQNGCKFLESSKFEENLIHAIDFASVELFTVTYLGLHLVRQCETQQTSET